MKAARRKRKGRAPESTTKTVLLQRVYIPLRTGLEENKRDFNRSEVGVSESGVISFHLKGRQPVSRAQGVRHVLGVENHKMQARGCNHSLQLYCTFRPQQLKRSQCPFTSLSGDQMNGFYVLKPASALAVRTGLGAGGSYSVSSISALCPPLAMVSSSPPGWKQKGKYSSPGASGRWQGGQWISILLKTA